MVENVEMTFLPVKKEEKNKTLFGFERDPRKSLYRLLLICLAYPTGLWVRSRVDHMGESCHTYIHRTYTLHTIGLS